MAVGFVLDFTGGSAQQYDAVVEEMALGGHIAEGGLFHAAGPHGDGWRVVDAWESDEVFQHFAESKIGPITASNGMSPPQITRFEIHNTRDSGRPRGDIRFVQVVRIAGIDSAKFDELDADVLGDGIPDALLYHVNGQGPDGEYIVADAWTSREERDDFMQSRVGPAAGRQGVSMPTVEDLEVHNTLEPRAGAVA